MDQRKVLFEEDQMIRSSKKTHQNGEIDDDADDYLSCSSAS